MKKMHKKYLGYFLIIAFIGLFGAMISNGLLSTCEARNMETGSLRNSATYSSSSTYVSAGGHYAIYIGYLSYNDYYYLYSFDNTNGNSFDVMLYTDWEYEYDPYVIGDYDWEDRLYDDYSSSSYTYYGYFDYSDGYYIVFQNNDASSTYLEYSIETFSSSYYYNPFSVLYPMIYVGIISLVVVIIVIALIVVAIRRNMQSTRNRTPTYRPTSYQPSRGSQGGTPVYNPYSAAPQPVTATPYQQPAPQKIGATYCRFCGDETTSDATFCPKCGSKL